MSVRKSRRGEKGPFAASSTKFDPNLRGGDKKVDLEGRGQELVVVVEFILFRRTCRARIKISHFTANGIMTSSVDLMIYSNGSSFKVDMELLERW